MKKPIQTCSNPFVKLSSLSKPILNQHEPTKPNNLIQTCANPEKYIQIHPDNSKTTEANQTNQHLSKPNRANNIHKDIF